MQLLQTLSLMAIMAIIAHTTGVPPAIIERARLQDPENSVGAGEYKEFNKANPRYETKPEY